MTVKHFIRTVLLIVGSPLWFNIPSFVLDVQSMEYHEKLEDTTLEEQARAIDKLFICQKCQGERLDESNSPFAQKIRAMVRDDIKNKKSHDEIVQKVVQHYGQSILLEPDIAPHTWLLWWAPWIILGLIIVIAFVVGLKRKKSK